MTWGAKGAEREKRSRTLLSQNKKKLTTQDFIDILRDHGNNSQWTPNQGPSATLCLHAANNLFRRSQTVCSFIANIGKYRKCYYTTAASNPCLSPFLPVFVPNTVIPKVYQKGKENYNSKSYWWKSEYLHRKALHNFSAALLKIQPEIINNEEIGRAHV